MKKYITFALILSFNLLSWAQERTKYEMNVSDFIELKVASGINVDYLCSPDSAGMVVFQAFPDEASSIMLSSTDEKLEIQLATKENGSYKNLPTVTVYSSFLSKIENSGDSTLRILSIAPQAKIKMRLIGNGRLTVHNIETSQLDASIATGHGIIVINGKTNGASLKTTGSGTIQADGLKANNVRCSILGTGSIGCTAEESLSVMGAGSGTVYYQGDPAIKNRSVGIKTSKIE